MKLKKYEGNPILKPNPKNEWEEKCVLNPAAIYDEESKKFVMLYRAAGNDVRHQIKLGLATSTDGIHFERISDEPVLPCGKPGEWNSSESGHPYAFTDDDGRQYLFFQGNNDKGKTWYLSCKEIIWQGDMPTFKDLD